MRKRNKSIPIRVTEKELEAIDANAKKKSIGVLTKDTIVRNYGYYGVAPNGVKWLYVATDDGLVGYCSSAYLKKC